MMTFPLTSIRHGILGGTLYKSQNNLAFSGCFGNQIQGLLGLHLSYYDGIETKH